MFKIEMNKSYTSLLMAALLMFGCPAGYAQHHVLEKSDCLTYTVEVLQGGTVHLIPDKGVTILNGNVSKTADLNFDGLDDLIVKLSENIDSCGGSILGVYVQNGNGKYTCVFRPEQLCFGDCDLLESECNLVNGVRWMKLLLYSCAEYGAESSVPTSVLQFDGKGYKIFELQSSGNSSDDIDPIKSFVVEKEYRYRNKTFQSGRLLLKGNSYGPLTLRIIEAGHITDICASMDEYPDLELSATRLIRLHDRPFFFVKDRYRVYLIDLEKESISARIEPGEEIEYGDDAISGTIGGFRFFDRDQYMIGAAVSYGLFCFNISELDRPTELKRYTYSSDFSDRGQPYFFLEENADGTYNGIISRSDTTKKSSYISGFYTETLGAAYLFQDAKLTALKEEYADPADYEAERRHQPYLLLHERMSDGRSVPWVVDLVNGRLLKGKSAHRFLEGKR